MSQPDARFNLIGLSFKVEFNLDSMPRNDQAVLFRHLMDKMGITDLIVEDDQLAEAVRCKMDMFIKGE